MRDTAAHGWGTQVRADGSGVCRLGGLQVEAEAGGFSGGLSGHEGIEGAGGMNEAGAGVGDEDPDAVALGGGLDADRFLAGRIDVFYGFNGELEAVEHGLAYLLCIAEGTRQGGRNVQTEVDG